MRMRAYLSLATLLCATSLAPHVAAATPSPCGEDQVCQAQQRVSELEQEQEKRRIELRESLDRGSQDKVKTLNQRLQQTHAELEEARRQLKAVEGR